MEHTSPIEQKLDQLTEDDIEVQSGGAYRMSGLMAPAAAERESAAERQARHDRERKEKLARIRAEQQAKVRAEEAPSGKNAKLQQALLDARETAFTARRAANELEVSPALRCEAGRLTELYEREFAARDEAIRACQAHAAAAERLFAAEQPALQVAADEAAEQRRAEMERAQSIAGELQDAITAADAGRIAELTDEAKQMPTRLAAAELAVLRSTLAMTKARKPGAVARAELSQERNRLLLARGNLSRALSQIAMRQISVDQREAQDIGSEVAGLETRIAHAERDLASCTTGASQRADRLARSVASRR
jgi:hypothetical protein